MCLRRIRLCVCCVAAQSCTRGNGCYLWRSGVESNVVGWLVEQQQQQMCCVCDCYDDTNTNVASETVRARAKPPKVGSGSMGRESAAWLLLLAFASSPTAARQTNFPVWLALSWLRDEARENGEIFDANGEEQSGQTELRERERHNGSADPPICIYICIKLILIRIGWYINTHTHTQIKLCCVFIYTNIEKVECRYTVFLRSETRNNEVF